MKDKYERADDESAPEEVSDEQVWQEFTDAEGPEPDEGEAPEVEEEEEPEPLEEEPEPEGEAQPTRKELEEQVARISEKLDRARGQIRGEQARADRKQKELQQTRERLKRLEEASRERQKRQEKVKAASEEYPDVIGPVADELMASANEFDDVRSDLAERAVGLNSDLQDHYQRQAEILLEEHPDAKQFMAANAKAFRAWIEDQPKRFRDIWHENSDNIKDGLSTALLVSEFKQSISADPTPPPDARRQRQMEGARSASPKSRRRASAEPDPESASDEDWWKYWDRKG